MSSSTPFVSYAQNREDVMLYRALGHIEHGFYVDIGAAHPDFDSVTKAFYDRGWSGVNVEPSTQYFPLLQEKRTRDVNLDCAISITEGDVVFWDVAESGNSTLNPELAQKSVDEGFTVTERTVKSRQLCSLTRDFASKEVHFLKIDAEDSERQVLESADFATFRPWIVVVEATVPGSTEPNYEEWEGTILENRYQFAYFDGLNRFYVAEERAELAEAFSRPPCVFDHFITFHEHLLMKERDRLQERTKELEKERANHAKISARLTNPPVAEELPATEPGERSEDLWRKLRDTVLDRDAEIVELAEENLQLLKTRPEKNTFAKKVRVVFGAEEAEAVSRERLKEKISRLRLEIKERFQTADEAWLRDL